MATKGEVLIRRDDREQCSMQLTTRVIEARAPGSNILKMFRIYLSKEMDTSFFYSLEMAEENYARLKESEQLLVDFNGFLEKLISLLEQCFNNGSEADLEECPISDAPSSAGNKANRFRAVFHFGSGHTNPTLRLIECNEFKELPHITLQLRSGNDSAIKDFLSFRLDEVQTELAKKAEELHTVKKCREGLVEDLDSCRLSLDNSQKNHKKDKHDSELLVQSLQKKLRIAEKRIEDMEIHNEKMCSMLSLGEENMKKAEDSVKHSDSVRAELENKISHYMKRLNLSEQNCKDVESRAAAASERCQGFEAAFHQAEARIEEWRGLALSHEARANTSEKELESLRKQINSSSQEEAIIRDRLEKAQQSIGMLQEELKEARLVKENSTKVERELQEKVRHLENDRDLIQEKLEQANYSVEQTREKLSSNEKMISWLNRQLTTVQLQAANMTGISAGKVRKCDEPPSTGAKDARWQQPPFRYSELDSTLVPVTPPATKVQLTEQSTVHTMKSSNSLSPNNTLPALPPMPRPWVGPEA